MRTIVITEKGKRADNQDYVLVSRINSTCSLYIVSDGMGGYEYGAKAAKIVVENIETYLSTVKEINEKDIQMAINKANLAIRQHQQDSQEKMGATVGGVILTANKTVCFWVGDVKVFQFQDKQLRFETKSHTLMNEMIHNRSISDIDQLSKYKHVVTRSVQGDVGLSKIGYEEFEQPKESDLFLICSDGVHDMFDGHYIQQILIASDTVDEAIKKIKTVLDIDSKDNFSMIAVIF